MIHSIRQTNEITTYCCRGDARCAIIPAMRRKRQDVPITIGIEVTRDVKAHRDKLSGVLRYASSKPDWNVVILERDTRPTIDFDASIVLLRSALRRLDAHIPAVTVDQFCDASCRRPNILVDNRAIGATAADLFVRRGLVNLAAIRFTVKGDDAHSAHRVDAFAATVAKAGLSASLYTPKTAEESLFLCGSETFQKWLLELPKPCGIFCFYDRQARDVLDSCRRARLDIPNQIAILGVDNETDICEMTRPTLSSIQPDFEAAGYLAAKVLDQMLSHRKVKPTYSYGILQLVERESTRPMNSGGRIVSAAMRMIQTADTLPAVADLAGKLRVSTTFLNRRFNEILGHGPKVEIDRQRLSRVKSLLRDPSQSVAEVSSLCHFSYPEALHLFFRRRTGLTPSQWRNHSES